MMQLCSKLKLRHLQCFDTIEVSLGGLLSKQATFEITMTSIAESQQVVIHTITTLNEKLDFIAINFENVITIPPAREPSSIGCVDQYLHYVCCYASTTACGTTTAHVNTVTPATAA